MPTRVRVGVIGTGGISRYHMGGWTRSRLGRLVAACDIRPSKVAEFCEQFGLPASAAYTDARAMLRREELDCVSICTWAQAHADVTVAAAKAGVRGILCEKPLCYSVREADAMRRAIEAHGTKVLVMHQRRYSARVTKARRLLAKGAIGTPLTLVARGGGGLTNTHSHTVDTMRYLLGDPQAAWVMAQVERTTNRWERCYPVEDCLVGLVAFEGGVRGVLESDTLAKGEKSGLWVYGTAGAIDLWGGPHGVPLLMSQKTKGHWETIEAKDTDLPVCYVRDLVRWLDGGPEPRLSFHTAYHTHEILMGFYESARTRRRVAFPLRNRRRVLQQMIDDGDLPLKKKRPYDIRTPDAFKAGYR